MDLIGAWVVNFYRITDNINSTETQSVKKIKVPHYQRPYSWGPEEVKNLIDDWKEEHERGNDEEYFAGSIVTVKNDDFHSLVDGQQRFTTIFLANMDDFADVNEIYGEYFSHKPARSTVAVKTLPKNALVEIECVAVI